MSKLKKPVSLETTFGVYEVFEVIGEGGAGRVYGAVGPDRTQVAIKVLTTERANAERRRRFKNEIGFLLRHRHANIVSVIDHGVANSSSISGPFYVMRRYASNMRGLLTRKIDPKNALPIFGKILDGVEAAHLLGAIHRDLKPENILFDVKTNAPAVADFGVASFTDDLLITSVETAPTQRLANFMYAAPEQRVPGRRVTATADIYALGLMLNEIFTGEVPHGTDFQQIGKSNPEFGYLDAVVAQAMKQEPSERFDSVAQLKAAIAAHRAEFLSLQKISQIDGTVIPAGEVDEPLAHEPPKLIGAEWDRGMLTLQLDRPVNREWVQALQQDMGSFTYPSNAHPTAFNFNGAVAKVPAQEHDAQQIIDHVKRWLPQATTALKHRLHSEAVRREQEMQAKLKRERQAEEQRLRVNRSLKI